MDFKVVLQACKPLWVSTPEDGIGSTSSQAPKSFVIEVSKRARVLGSGAFSKRASAEADVFKVLQAFWRCWATPWGGARSCPAAHRSLASSTWGIGEPWRRGGTIWSHHHTTILSQLQQVNQQPEQALHNYEPVAKRVKRAADERVLITPIFKLGMKLPVNKPLGLTKPPRRAHVSRSTSVCGRTRMHLFHNHVSVYERDPAVWIHVCMCKHRPRGQWVRIWSAVSSSYVVLMKRGHACDTYMYLLNTMGLATFGQGFWDTLYTMNLDNGNTVMKPKNSHRRMIVFSKWNVKVFIDQYTGHYKFKHHNFKGTEQC